MGEEGGAQPPGLWGRTRRGDISAYVFGRSRWQLQGEGLRAAERGGQSSGGGVRWLSPGREVARSA